MRILFADQSALDAQFAVMPEGNDGARERKRFGGPGLGRVVQTIDALLEFGQTVLVGIVALDQLVVFLGQTVKLGLIGFRKRSGFRIDPLELAKRAVVGIGKDLDPAPAFGGYALRVGGEFFRDETVEQCRVLQVAAILVIEEILTCRAAGGSISLDADKADTLVRCRYLAFGEQAPDGMGGTVPFREFAEDALLRRVVVADREGLSIFKIDFSVAVGFKDDGRQRPSLRRCATTLSAMPNLAATSAIDAPLSISALKASNWSAGCMGARTTFSARLSSAGSISPSASRQGISQSFSITPSFASA